MMIHNSIDCKPVLLYNVRAYMCITILGGIPMKKVSGRLLSIFLALVMIASVSVPLTATAADAQGNVYPTIFNMSAYFSGDCGKSTTYNCFPDGSMGIFGTGAIEDFSLLNGKSTAPWYKDMSETISNNYINKIAVEYGVTHIGDYSFYLSDRTRYVSLYNVDISNTVTSIGKYAFYNQKLEEVIIPPTVTQIGENAFGSMENLKKITYYGDPDSITNWDSIVTSPVTVHILKNYSHANTSRVTFVSDMDDPYSAVGDKERNIGAYYGSSNSKVLGGAAPFIIVGKFDNVKKSVTYGNTGFATCVQYGTETVGSSNKVFPSYYLLTNNANGSLNRVSFNFSEETQGRIAGSATGYDASPFSDMSLNISHEYVGPDTVKMIYTLKNNTNSVMEGIKLGSTGDIKIGADDQAAITPIVDNNKQIGFYMISNNEDYDESESGKFSTFGFIGKNVEKTQGSANEGYYDGATYFYGTAGATVQSSATGSRQLTLLPERIFTPGTGAMTDNTLPRGVDSGMSYFWDDITLESGESKQFAILFSVYGAMDDEYAQEPPKEDSKTADDDTTKFLNVTWMNGNQKLCDQSMKPNEVPAYPLTDPVKQKAPTDPKSYSFVGWSTNPSASQPDTISAIQADTIYYAVYKENRLFKGHSLSLDGDIGLNFFVDLSNEGNVNPENVTIKFEWFVNGEKKQQTCTLDAEIMRTVRDKDGQDHNYYLAKCKVPSAEMAYNIHAAAEINGNPHWDKDVYSVKDYCMDLIEETNDTDLKNLAEKTLNYGAKSQIIFHRENADLGLADARLTQEKREAIANQMSAITPANIRATINAQNNNEPKSNMNDAPHESLQYAGSSLVCLTTTSLRHYYKITGEGYPITAEGGFTFHDEKDGFIYFEYTDISAPSLDKFIPFTINGITYKFSALDYVGNTLLSETSTNEEKELARSLYLYNTASNAYFDKQTS